MESSGEIDISKFTQPENVIVVNVNFRMEIFDRIFSKLETTNALDYLSGASRRLDIPEVHVETIPEGTASDDPELSEFSRIKELRRRSRTAPRSILDQKLNDNFSACLPDPDALKISSEFGDLFKKRAFLDFISNTGRRTILFTGFFTELEILRTALSSQEHGYFGIVVSDATSTYSERIYYEALDLISQSAEVIDTRDLMKIWP